MNRPIPDEMLWGVPRKDMPKTQILQAENGWCAVHDTQCAFWVVNFGHIGCVLEACRYFPEGSP